MNKMTRRLNRLTSGGRERLRLNAWIRAGEALDDIEAKLTAQTKDALRKAGVVL